MLKDFDTLVSDYDKMLNLAWTKLPDPNTYKGFPYYEVLLPTLSEDVSILPPVKCEDFSSAFVQYNKVGHPFKFTFMLVQVGPNEKKWVNKSKH